MGRAAGGFELFDFTEACEVALTEIFDVLLSVEVDFIDREDTPFDTGACEGCFGVIEVLLFKDTWLVLLFDGATSAAEGFGTGLDDVLDS